MPHEPGIPSLDHSELKQAVRRLVAEWVLADDPADFRPGVDPEASARKALDPYLASIAVVNNGDDFAVLTWGAAMSRLSGGDRANQMLSTLPQPMRSHLRRVCVRATAWRAPAMSAATWAIEGDIWRCVLVALPTESDGHTVKKLLAAVLYAPHPLFHAAAVAEGVGWPAAIPRGAVHGIRGMAPLVEERQPGGWRRAAQVVRRLFPMGEARG